MRLTTNVLDKAAFFTTFHGKMLEIKGRYPHNVFIIEVSRWIVLYEQLGGWVPYNRFCNQRRAIKRKARKLAGLPQFFTGNHDTGFKFGDIALVRPFSEREKEKLGLK